MLFKSEGIVLVAKIYSSGLMGVNGYTVEVEVDTSQGLPSFETVGLPDSAVKESKERVRTAIKNSGYTFPVKENYSKSCTGKYKKRRSGL